MISAGDFKNGLTLEIDGNVVQIDRKSTRLNSSHTS